MSSPRPQTLRELARRTSTGRTSARALVERSLERLAAHDAELGAFSSVDVDRARARADALDAEGPAGRPLFGIPFAVKANLAFRGLTTDASSLALAGWRAPFEATAVRRLVDAGAIPIGVTRMDEFGMGSSGENACDRATSNPWDPSRVPGGSSSGSAAAVAARLVPFALGSDTGGSVRQPAALCGIVGSKPTYGRVSRHGLIAYASSLDTIGPLATSVEDAEFVASLLVGHDAHDASTAGASTWTNDERPNTRLRLLVPEPFLGPGIEPGVRAAIERALEALESTGATVERAPFPILEKTLSAYYVIACSEASSNLARFDGTQFGVRGSEAVDYESQVRSTRMEGFGREVERRILLGTYVLSAAHYERWVGRSHAVRRQLTAEFEAAFERCDLIVGPTSPSVAFRLGDRAHDPVAMMRADTLTVPVSLAGLPAASVPAGLVDGLPVGLQIVGRRDGDELVHRAAAHLEASFPPLAPETFRRFDEEGWA